MAAIAQIAKIRGPKLNNTWAFQVKVLYIAESIRDELETGKRIDVVYQPYHEIEALRYKW